MFVLFRRHSNHIIEKTRESLTEKHLNRISNDVEYYKQDSAEDEWAHITGIGSKIEAIDPLAVTDRSIIFEKDAVKSTKENIIKEKTDQFKDQMGNTNQYLKFFNAHLAAKKIQLDKIKEREKKFEEEIDALQGNNIKPRSELDKVYYKDITENDIKSLIVHIESEREQIKEKLSHQELQVEKTKLELWQKEEQLQHMHDEIERKNKKKVAIQSMEDPLLIIKEELAKLGINDDSGKIASTLSALSSRTRHKD